MSYKELSDEDKLKQAIAFVTAGQPLPKDLVEFLEEVGLYEAVTAPSDHTK